MSDRDDVAEALPDYEIGDELGRGAWGVVLAARHRKLGRDVAIKQLPRTHADDREVVQRFVNEAQVLASLSHIHLVPIYDFIERDGLCLLVMERLTGGSLTNRFRAGADPRDAAAATLAASAGLHYAHQHGVLHRDIKPDNIMFSRDGLLKVTDFGIAKVLGGSESVVTRAGYVLGTPSYMAPEQAKGEALTPATDVYSLGMILYELLAGELPFEQESNPLAVLYRHVHENPVPLLEMAPTTPPELAGVVMRALERDATARYETAEAFGVAVAASAREAWGSRWLAESTVTVAAAGPILAAAHGERAPATVVTQVPDEWPSPATAPAPSVPPPSPASPAPAAPPEPPRDPTPEPLPAAAASEPPAPPPPAPPAAEPAGTGPQGPPPRRRMGLALAVAAGLALAGGAVAVISGGGDDEEPAPAQAALAGSKLPLEATGGWRELASAPSARQQVAATELAGTIWVLGGLTQTGSGATVATPRVEGYDPAIDTWKTGPDLPLPLHHAAAVNYKGELLVIGGWRAEGENLTAGLSDAVYALREGAWVEAGRINKPRAAAAAAVVGDKIVLAGGQADGKLVRETEVFDGKEWKVAAPMPTPREHLAAASDGGGAYFVGGRALSADKNSPALERYDPAKDRWEKLPNMPTARGGLAATVLEGQLVAAGGETTTSVLGTVETYNPATRQWRKSRDMQTPRHGLAAVGIRRNLYTLSGAGEPTHSSSLATAEVIRMAVRGGGAAGGQAQWRSLRPAPSARQQVAAAELSGTIWLLGGLRHTSTNATVGSQRVEGYDPAIDTWKTGPDLPLQLHHEAAVNYNGELVVIGGWRAEGQNLTAEVSNRVFALRGGQWVELPSLKRPRAAAAAAVAGGMIVVAGGQADGKLVEGTEVFDGKEWKVMRAIPTPREHVAAASDGRYAYFVGGRALAADKNSAALERYDPANNRWSKLPDMPTARGGLAAAIVGGRELIAVGGETTTSVLGTAEGYDLRTRKWRALTKMKTPRHGLAAVAVGRSLYTLAGATAPTHSSSTGVAEVLGRR